MFGLVKGSDRNPLFGTILVKEGKGKKRKLKLKLKRKITYNRYNLHYTQICPKY